LGSRDERLKLIEKYRNSVCRIICSWNSVETSFGTGFFVDKGLLLTCNHVVTRDDVDTSGFLIKRYCPNIRIETVKGVFNASIVNKLDNTHPIFEDYAILSIPDISLQNIPLGSYNSTEIGNDCIILGFPFGNPNLLVTSALVSAKYKAPSHINQIVLIDKIALDSSINKGNSGGPVIDIMSSSVIGIVSTRLGTIEDSLKKLMNRLGNDLPELVEIFKQIDRYINVGLGEAVSIEYASKELDEV